MAAKKIISPSSRMNAEHDNCISESRCHEESPDLEAESQSVSCCMQIKHALCCNRVHVEGNKNGSVYETSISSQHRLSISSRTMQSVQNAIEGKISLSNAKLHRYLTTPNFGPSKKFAPYSIYHFPLSLFNDYGVGNKLYFEFLCSVSVLSLIICMLYIPIFIILMNNSIDEYSNGNQNEFVLQKLSLGSLGNLNSSSTLITSHENVVDLFGISLDYQQTNQYIAYTDFLCILLLLLYITYFESQLRRKEKESDDMTKTVGDFSIEVTNLPPSCTSRQALADWFQSKWGEITDCSICYNDGQIIKLYQNHAKILNEFTKCKVSYAKATKASTRAKESSKLQRLQAKLDHSHLHLLHYAHRFERKRFCVKAYVTFENEPQRNECLREYYGQSFKYLLCRKNPRFIFENHLLKLSKAPEPSNIVYLNHGYSTLNVLARRLLTSILSGLIILASFGLVFSAQFAAKSSRIDTTMCDSLDSTQFDSVNIDENLYSTEIINCYCLHIGFAAATSDSLCSSYFRSYLKSQGFTALSSIIIVCVNLVLQNVIKLLVEYEKHSTVSSHQSALAAKIFFSQFMNTALTILIINCNLDSLGVGIGNIFNGEHDINFASDWYGTVGNSIIFTMVLGCFNPHLTPLLTMRYKQRKRRRAVRTVYTQNELNKMFEGQPFTLSDRFAGVSVAISVILLYSPLLPLLWIVLFATCFCNYWFNKIYFLRIAAIPPRYDTQLARSAAWFIKIGISLHLAMSIWVYGNQDRSPTYFDYTTYIKPYVMDADDEQYDTLFRVIFNYNALPFFVLLVLLHLVTLMKNVINFLCCRSEQIEDEAELLPFSQELARSDNMELYLVSAQETLKDAFGDDLLPAEHILNEAKIEKAELDYKEQLAKEMVNELMQVEDVEGSSSEIRRASTQFFHISPEYWKITEVGTWLQRLKCGQKYMYQFMFNKVDGQRLLNITDVFLEETIGIKRIVDRNSIMKAVRKLRIKCGLDAPIKKKLSKEKRKELEKVELENYMRHIDLTEEYTQFAHEYQKELKQTKSGSDHEDEEEVIASI